MKYIRTKDGIQDIMQLTPVYPYKTLIEYIEDNAINDANTIEELCDRCIVIRQFYDFYKIGSFYECEYEIDCFKRKIKSNSPIIAIYGAIWTSKGLIYAAKMNEKGELELL